MDTSKETRSATVISLGHRDALDPGEIEVSTLPGREQPAWA